MRRLKATRALLLATQLLLAACADRQTSPLMPENPRRLEHRDDALHLGEVGFTCSLYRRSVGSGGRIHIWTRQATLYFPRPEVSSAGTTLTYAYRGYAGGHALVAYADCVIPATEAAIVRTHRFFGVRAALETAPLVTTTSCPEVDSDGSCVYHLDTLPVTTCTNPLLTYPDCGTPKDVDYDYCGMDTGCGGGGNWDFGSGGTSGGGGGWNSGYDDGTGPCIRDANGACTERDLSADEWRRLGERIDAIDETTEACKGAKAALRELYNRGPDARRFRFWTGYNLEINTVTGDTTQPLGQNLSDAGGRYIAYDPRWVWDEPRTVVHEGLHLWLSLTNSPLTGEANENWVDEEEENCI